MDFNSLSAEDCERLQASPIWRITTELLEEYYSGSCSLEAATLALMRLFRPDIPDPPAKRGRPINSGGNSFHDLADTGEKLEELITQYRNDPDIRNAVGRAYGQTRGSKRYLDKCRKAYRERIRLSRMEAMDHHLHQVNRLELDAYDEMERLEKTFWYDATRQPLYNRKILRYLRLLEKGHKK